MNNFYKIISFCALLAFTVIGCKDQAGNKGGNELDNGFEYTILKSTGGAVATSNQVVSLDFELVNDKGEVLDNSREVNGPMPTILIPEKSSPQYSRNPFISLLAIMAVGDSATMRVPIDSIPNAPAIFKESAYIDYVVKINNIEDQEVYKTRAAAEEKARRAEADARAAEMKGVAKGHFDDYMAGRIKGTPITLENGLKITPLDSNEGEKANPGDQVSVQYYGFLKDGTSFDNSYRAGRPFKFAIGTGAVIQGWDLGIPQVGAGNSAILDIPFNLAYGPNGNPPTIPAKSDLIFYIKVEEVNKK